MGEYHAIGKSFYRKESLLKVTGKARYTADNQRMDTLYVSVLISSCAHAKIIRIETEKAKKISGVKAVVIGADFSVLTGPSIKDRPPLAFEKVRYHGEPVALVIAETKQIAEHARSLINVQYDPLPVVNSVREAIMPRAPLVHENAHLYEVPEGEMKPEKGTNHADRTKVRKGDVETGWLHSDVTVEVQTFLPQADHVMMEARAVSCEILPDGRVLIESSTQSPFVVAELIGEYFNIPSGNIIVNVPFVGGAFGGKTSVFQEVLAFLASRAVGGRQVQLVNTREEEFMMSPVHIGMDATVKIGASNDGKIQVMECEYLFDIGAYSDRGVFISRAAASDCTGPYKVDNVHCDSVAVYTNHPFATAFRGFGHLEQTFAVERAVDELAKKLMMCPLELRLKNAITIGDMTPTRVKINKSNAGNVTACLEKLKEHMNWEEGIYKEKDNLIYAKGISAFWKNTNTPTNAGAGAVVTFNKDGSVNVNTGVVELGQGAKTQIAILVAEGFQMDVEDVHVFYEVNTEVSPEHWKTAASRATLLTGRAVLAAVEDAKKQLKQNASYLLLASIDDIRVNYGKAYVHADPSRFVAIKDIAFGAILPNGNAVGEKVIGRGSYISRNLTKLNEETGAGNPGPEWTIGVAGVEVEWNKQDYTYKINRAVCVVDAGQVLNYGAAIGQIMGGMSMGVSYATREGFIFDEKGVILNPQLRSYKVIRYGEAPYYKVDFVETKDEEGPYGARGIGEHGIIGIPAAIANALSLATGKGINQIPIIPEYIWRLCNDTIWL